MMTDEDVSEKISKVYRYIDAIKARALIEPDKVERVLSRVLDELQMGCEGSSSASSEQCRKKCNENQYYSIYKNSFDGIMLTRPDGTILSANSQACNLFGMTEEEIVRAGRDGLVINDEWLAAALKERETFGQAKAELRYRRKDGTTFIGEVSSVTFTDVDGSTKTSMIFRDVTERKRAEEELYASNQMLQLVLDTIPQNVFWKDRNLTFLGCNRAFANHKGVDDPSAISGKDESELGWDGVIEPHHRDDRLVMETDTPKLNYEEPLMMPGGRQLWLRTSKVPLHSKSGEVIGILVSFEDITERKRIEDELCKARDRLEQRVLERTADLQKAYAILEEKEEQNRQLADLSPDAVSVFKDGRVVFVNNAGIRLLGASGAGDVIGKTVEDIVHPDFTDIIKGRVQNLLENIDQNPPVEQKILRLDGQAIDIESASARIMYDGSPAVLVVARDITARKAAESELRMAKEDAEAAARAKSEFLATMSHEIRTPMNAVLGMASILKATDLDPEQKECIETIDSSGRALLGIIDDILDFTKMERGKMKLKCQPFVPRSCIEESLDQVASSASEKGLELSYEIEGRVPDVVLGDSSRIRQVLVNLLSNSVKFTEVGEIEVYLNASRDHDDLYEMLFEVRDTGIGISKSTLERLFEPFNQEDMSNTRKYGGTGLGLAISRSLVEMMGGRIWAQSTPGEGSIFRFTVMAEAYAGPLEDVTPSLARCNIDMLGRNRDLRILLAEDNPINQRMTLLMLKKMGYRADAVANGLEVLEALKQSRYDVILMDVQMPEMDGIEATMKIREMWPTTPKIIALTAYALDGDREMCLEAGMDGYLSKPMKEDELAMLLGNIAIQDSTSA